MLPLVILEDEIPTIKTSEQHEGAAAVKSENLSLVAGRHAPYIYPAGTRDISLRISITLVTAAHAHCTLSW